MCKQNNCIVGIIADKIIRHKEWESRQHLHLLKVRAFDIVRTQLPYPGHCVRFNFCPECGKKINNN